MDGAHKVRGGSLFSMAQEVVPNIALKKLYSFLKWSVSDMYNVHVYELRSIICSSIAINKFELLIGEYKKIFSTYFYTKFWIQPKSV